MKSNTIIMFDMDGTLTESRQSLNSKNLMKSLYNITNNGFYIGVITGSDDDYLQEQMGDFLAKSPCRYSTHLMPCNGTKHYKPPKFANKDFELVHNVSMKKKMGPENYRKLISELILSQVDMSNEGVPLTGHFINCRGSMINWCPIGRNANLEEREEFIKIDKSIDLRVRVIDELKQILDKNGLLRHLTIKFGGDTSFDIYPKGWDKTYGLNHFRGWDIWFVGDRCYENGNDYEISNACGKQAYISTGPENTVEIIEDILKRLKKEKK